MCPRVSSERSGTKPGRVRPEAITVMKVLGTDISGTVDEQLASIKRTQVLGVTITMRCGTGCRVVSDAADIA